MNNNAVTEIPMTTVVNPAAYTTIENMTTDKNIDAVPEQSIGQCVNHRYEEFGAPSSSLLRLRGGGGCITDCLAAIGCCCICEECCC